MRAKMWTRPIELGNGHLNLSGMGKELDRRNPGEGDGEKE